MLQQVAVERCLAFAGQWIKYESSEVDIGASSLSGQLHARGMSSKTLLTLFLTFTQHFNSHQLLPKRNYHFSISTCAFLKKEFKPLSSTRQWILTTTTISLLSILNTASVLSLRASSSAFVDSAQTMMTSWSNLRR